MLLLRGHLTPLPITEAIPDYRTTRRCPGAAASCFAAVPSGYELYCIMCRALGSVVRSKPVPCVRFGTCVSVPLLVLFCGLRTANNGGVFNFELDNRRLFCFKPFVKITWKPANNDLKQTNCFNRLLYSRDCKYKRTRCSSLRKIIVLR